uniref:Taste receptor type 2 n=1 Tax=Leptobrachium leishanense TaxID=445787 RepID=A0A8C5MGL9_9ANUR
MCARTRVLIKVLEFTIGLALNGFIVTVNLIWWWKSRTLQTLDLMILNLGLARVMHLIIYSMYESPLFTNMTLHGTEYLLPINLCAGACIYYYNLWSGALLCIFYCVKITNYSHRFFTYLKRNLARLVPRFLVASLAISFGCCLPFGWFLYDTETINSINVTGEFYEQRVVQHIYNILIIHIGSSALPLFLFCTAFSLLIRSLWSHTQHMKGTSYGFRPPQLDAHINALKNMLSFIFLYLISFASSALLPLSLRSNNNMYVRLCTICIFLYPSLHSIPLIWRPSTLQRLSASKDPPLPKKLCFKGPSALQRPSATKDPLLSKDPLPPRTLYSP